MVNKDNGLEFVLVAVYGSLKRGFGNHSILSESKHPLPLYTGLTEERYCMYSLGSFPAITKTATALIEVEVYSVDKSTLSRLDRLEGHPYFYQREEVKIVTDTGMTVTAWIYFLNDKRNLDNASIITGFSLNDKYRQSWNHMKFNLG